MDKPFLDFKAVLNKGSCSLIKALQNTSERMAGGGGEGVGRGWLEKGVVRRSRWGGELGVGWKRGCCLTRTFVAPDSDTTSCSKIQKQSINLPACVQYLISHAQSRIWQPRSDTKRCRKKTAHKIMLNVRHTISVLFSRPSYSTLSCTVSHSLCYMLRL